MHALRDILDQAEKKGVAIGHFNVADLVSLKAVFGRAGTEGPGPGWSFLLQWTSFLFQNQLSVVASEAV